ncbi:MAG: heme-copper oxidase subunit III [Deltaproteobacteria bacterium]|nr:heme-copper oxidase subunit III [Deltaproteobacteria bacterium]
MDIPYTVSARKDTGLYNGKLGLWLFLASEVMLFGGLFSALVLIRVGNAVWPPAGTPELNVALATFNTAVLITSSVTAILSWASLAKKDLGGFKKYMGITIVCGFIFLMAKSFEYYGKLSHGVVPSTNVFMGVYYTMTFLHVLHVIGGLAVMIYLWGPGSKMWHTNPGRFSNRIECTGLYWHFVDLVWIFLFPVLYLL